MKSTLPRIFNFMPSRLHILHLTILFSAVVTVFDGVALAADPQNASETIASTSSQSQNEFEYRVQNRKDPFVPFITEKATTTTDVDMSEIVDVSGKLTGMQLFEPGQLNLVALMKSGNEDFAMVEDFTGKGYVINKGTKIGKRGVVVEIAPNKVVIEETAQTRAGQKIVTNTVMVLKKEGEE
ncbi:pilus assembly protein PilP [Desulfopila aestuarii]|nr:pilus assembly protein PilP [Desulfopila aestuarii]